MGRNTLKNAGIALAVVAGLALGTGGTAMAANTVRSIDIVNGTIRHADLDPEVRKAYLKDDDTKFNPAQLQAQIDALEDRVEQLEAEDESGVNTNWVANDGAEIVDANTVTVSNEGTPAGSSVEIVNLDLPVQATKTVQFTYELADGAVYGGGSPRVFLEISGTYYNTHDDAPADAGVDNGDGTFTKTWTIPANGRVGNAGVVQDSGTGTITVTDLVISDHQVKFQ